jgi:hypothetical protein
MKNILHDNIVNTLLSKISAKEMANKLICVFDETPVRVIYEPCDFISWNDGMGETGFGTVLERLPSGAYAVAEARNGNRRTIGASGIFGLSSMQEFDRYEDLRSAK